MTLTGYMDLCHPRSRKISKSLVVTEEGNKRPLNITLKTAIPEQPSSTNICNLRILEEICKMEIAY